MSVPDFAEITKKTPERSLIEIKKKHAGRNSYGKITVRHHGGGNKQKYRIIDFKRNMQDAPAKVIGIEYDPNRTAYLLRSYRRYQAGQHPSACQHSRRYDHLQH